MYVNDASSVEDSRNPGVSLGKLSIVIPLYNEEERLESLVKGIVSYMRHSKLAYELILVNDGSTDETAAIGKAISDRDENIRCISYSPNRGKGYAVKQGVLSATGDFVLFTDADLSTPLYELDRFLEYIGNYDLVIASRALRESRILVTQPWRRRIMGRAGHYLIQIVLKLGIHDTQCGFKLFSKRALSIFEKQTIDGFGFDFKLLCIAKEEKFRVLETAVTWENGGDSRVKTRDFIKTLLELLKVKINVMNNRY